MSTDDGRPKILKELEEGLITAKEASARLSAMESAVSIDRHVQVTPIREDELPHVRDYRGNWKAPFLLSMGGMLLAGSRMADSRRKSGLVHRMRIGFYGMLFMLTGLVAVLSLWSRDARWLLIQVARRDGGHIQLSLPVPVHLLGKLLSMMRPLADRDTAQEIDAAVEFIEAMQEQMDSPDGQPVVIDFTSDTGDRVKVYLM